MWPLIYKPMFHPHTTSQPLLLAMLAIAACVAPPPEAQEALGIDKDKLFQMAESALHRCRIECRVDIIQSLILLSLRQTGCGDKHSAFTYAGRACCMALNLGLNLAPASYESPAESEVRARVYVSGMMQGNGMDRCEADTSSGTAMCLTRLSPKRPVAHSFSRIAAPARRCRQSTSWTSSRHGHLCPRQHSLSPEACATLSRDEGMS